MRSKVAWRSCNYFTSGGTVQRLATSVEEIDESLPSCGVLSTGGNTVVAA